MDFFEHQDRARRKTKWLVLVFVASAILTIFGVYFIVSLMFCGVAEWRAPEQPFFEKWWDPSRFAWVAGYSLVFIGFGSALKLLELRRGGKVIAEMLGGRLVQPNSQQTQERRLLNVVEEVCVASGIPVPHVYVLQTESGINSFAAGNTVDDAIIAVTHGALKTFGRDELQGVIAHEVSHIVNGDMRINTRLIGVLAGITTIAEFGRWLLRMAKFIAVTVLKGSRTNTTGEGNPVVLGVLFLIPLALAGLAILIVGSAGLLCARIVRAALSRQREFLADASAVQFTRNPKALVNALVKIRLHTDGSTVQDHHAQAASHFFFADALRRLRFQQLLATHPSIPERIVKLDPSKAGQVDHLAPRPGGRYRQLEDVMAVSPVDETEATNADVRPETSGSDLATAGVGHSGAIHLDGAQDWIRSLPDVIRRATTEPFGAQILVFALLIDEDERLQDKQLSLFEGDRPGSLENQIGRLLPDVRALGPAARLTLMDLALPALRQLSNNQTDQFTKTLRALVMADGQVDVFEFALEMALARHLERGRRSKKPRVPHIYAIAGVRKEVIVVLSTIAYGGSKKLDEVQHAYKDAVDSLLPGFNRPMIEPADCSLDAFETALKRLQLASPPIKRELLKACSLCVTHDGVVTPKEAELTRIVADVLDCPVPPLLASELTPKEP